MASLPLPSGLLQPLRRLRSLHVAARERANDGDGPQVNRKSLPYRLADVYFRTWDLGFTAFGGPPVHFQILHQRFVEGRGAKEKWVDEQTVRKIGLQLRATQGTSRGSFISNAVAPHVQESNVYICPNSC